jgi:hypothetical protein
VDDSLTLHWYKGSKADKIEAGTKVYITGWVTKKETNYTPKQDFGVKLSDHNVYKYFHIQK